MRHVGVIIVEEIKLFCMSLMNVIDIVGKGEY